MFSNIVGGTGPGLTGAKRALRERGGSGQRDKRRDVRPVVETLEPRALFSGGAIDLSFGSAGQVRADLGKTVGAGLLATQRDGKFLTVSYNTTADSSHEANLLRYNRNGTLDAGFGTGGVLDVNPGGNSNIDSILFQNDGKILVGLDDQNGAHIFRLTAAGARDTQFGTAGLVDVGKSVFSADLALASNGSIVVAGKKNSDPPGLVYPGGNIPYELAVLRYGSDGSPDLTFGANGEKDVALNGIAFPSAAAIERDGRIVIAGGLSHGGLVEPGIGFVARFDRHGNLDTAHGAGGIFYSNDIAPTSVALTRNGRILIDGSTLDGGKVGAQRLTTSLKLDKSFGIGGDAIVNLQATYSVSAEMVAQPDGKIVFAGAVYDGTGPTTTALARLRSDGRLDRAFGKNGIVEKTLPGNGSVSGIGIDGNRILLPVLVQPDATQPPFEIAVFAYKQ